MVSLHLAVLRLVRGEEPLGLRLLARILELNAVTLLDACMAHWREQLIVLLLTLLGLVKRVRLVGMVLIGDDSSSSFLLGKVLHELGRSVLVPHL